ncbi:hypothetical protein [Methylobacterium sp. A54F]
MLSKSLLMLTATVAALSLALAPTDARAQNAGSFLGGIAGGVLGGVIAGSMMQHARPRTVVVYGRPRHVRAAPRTRVARVRGTPAATTKGAQVVDASADPFAKSQAPVTTAVSNGR